MFPRAMALMIAVGLLVPGGSSRAQDATEMRALIQQLGSERFAEREEAERRLLQNDRAVVYIKAGVRDAAPEVSKRCARILEKRRAGVRDEIPRHLDEMSHRGEFNRAVRVAFAWRHDLREKLSDFEQTAAQRLCDAVEQKTSRALAIPKIAERLQIEVGGSDDVELLRPSNDFLVAGRRVKIGSMGSSVFLAAENMDSHGHSNSIAFVGGNAVIEKMYESIVYVDGDLTIGFVRNSLIVCTGSIGGMSSSFRNCTVVAAGKIKTPVKAENSILRPDEKDLAHILRPWTAAELGVQPVFREERVYAEKVVPMAQAGVEAGDVLLSLDGEKIATQAEATKLLRQKSAEYLPFFVRVKRGDHELELTVPWTLPRVPR